MAIKISEPDAVRLYDSLAPRYRRMHRVWLRHAGGEAQAALEAAARALLRPGSTLLDAGCGPGTLARSLLREGVSPRQVTLLDPSEAMLAQAADLPVRRVVGRLERLPFAPASFDLVTCAWALETVPRPAVAIAEMRRVVRPGGVICVAFCADAPPGSLAAWLLRRAVARRGTGRFLHRSLVAGALGGAGDMQLRWLPCRGPAAAILARRAEAFADAAPGVADGGKRRAPIEVTRRDAAATGTS